MPTPNIEVKHMCDVCDASIVTDSCKLPASWRKSKTTLGWGNGGFQCNICSACIRDFDPAFKKLWAKWKGSKA